MVTRFINKLASWGFLGAFLLIPVGVIGDELQPLTIRDFKSGLNTSVDSSLIPDGASPDLQNVDVVDGSIRKRNGTRLVNATAIGNDAPVRLLHEYVDPTNSFWLLAVSSNTLYGSTNGGATFSVLTSTHGIASTSRFQASNAFGKAYLVDGSTNAITFDGTSVALNTAAPIGGVTAFYAGRLWIANGSTIYGSRVSDATDWTDSGVDDADAFSAVVRNNDGYTITAMKPFGPDLFIFKAHSIDRLSVDSDGLNFSLSPVTSHLGTTHPDSVAATDNSIIWLAQDGYYGYDGSTIKWISADIDPTVKGITQLDALTRSYSETDMTEGTDTNTTAERVSGQVMLGIASQTDTTAADFSSGTLVHVSTSAINGSITATFATGATYTGESSSASSLYAYYPDSLGAVAGYATKIVPTLSGTITSIFSPIYLSGEASPRLFLRADNSGSPGAIISSSTVSITSGGGGDYTFSVSWPVTAATNYWIGLEDTGLDNIIWAYKALFASGNSMKVLRLSGAWADPIYGSGSGSKTASYVATSTPTVTVATGTFVSRTFDSGLASPKWKATTPAYTTNGQTVSFLTQASSDGVAWDSAVSWTPGSAPTSSSKRYIRYRVEFSTLTYAGVNPFVSEVSLLAVSSSGSYLSPAITLTGATSWLPFTAGGSADGGGLTYELYTDTNTSITPGNASTFISSQTLSAGQTPALAIAPYAFLAATMTTTGVPDPYVGEWQLQWGEGSISNIISSEFYNQKYYSAVSLGGAGNDTILIYDQNGAWTKYTGLEPYFMKKYRTNLLFGSAGAGDVVRMEEKNHFRDYDDAPISAYWTSKDFDLGAPITTKTLLRYYVTGNRVVGGNMTFGYGVERGTLTSSTYALDGLTGFFRQVVKPSSLTYSEGIQHRFKVSDATLDGDMSVLSVTGQWRLNTNP